MNKKFYITSAIPYVNAAPHIGHALEFIQTDLIARYHKLLGNDILMLCGGDENALKNVQAAEKAGVPIQQFVDQNTQKFLELSKKLNCQYDIWQKGSDQKHHYSSSQKLWQLCQKDIYQKTYKGLYCVGCETFYTPDELNEKGECFEHPGKKLEMVEEKNYFFNLKKYETDIKNLISSGKLEIVPNTRKQEVLSFLDKKLEDISISRSNERARNWGVPVPNDATQRMYVWFDALNIYQSGVGFGWDEEKYQKWWPADLHVIGKGITRFHAVYWPAFLLSANLPLPKKIFVHEYFTVNGQKMSKTVGNVYDPIPLLNKLIQKLGSHGPDALRYYCLAKISPFSDGDFSEEKFFHAYTSDLANGLGNLVARVAKLCETDGLEGIKDYEKDHKNLNHKLDQSGYSAHWDKFELNLAIDELWREIKSLDMQIGEDKPWTKTKEDREDNLKSYVKRILSLVFELKPFLPETARKIISQLTGDKIKSQPPLFPRLS